MTTPDVESTGAASRQAEAHAAETYARLMAAHTDIAAEGTEFDAHVVASILAISASEALRQNRSLAETAGFDDAGPLICLFPSEKIWLQTQSVPALARHPEELGLLDLLFRGSVGHTRLEAMLAGLMARRAQAPNHLWQDLGLANRGELTKLMQDRFRPLARRNRADMKWKKFFYRTLCRDADSALCLAPSCSECDDFDMCFGEENGECLLAHIRRKTDRAA